MGIPPARGAAYPADRMAAFPELAILRTELSGDALAHLERLAVSWRLLADLSFSDLLLFAPVAHEDGHRFVILAQVRPTTGQTLYVHDLVGDVVDEVERPSLARAWRHAEIHDGEATVVGGQERVRVRDACRCATAAGRSRCSPARRRPPRAGGPASSSATTSRSTTCSRGMVAEGTFPFAREEIEIEGAPRAGDGVIVLDADGGMRYASPNAVSSLHRLGIHAYTSGVRLGEIGFDEAAVDTAVRGRLPVIEEVEREEASVLVRVIPLMDKWKSAGALVLLRDVTDLRRRDRMLMSKDATIREIHHRVKNNLQTIASLLRLQGRRVDSKEARHRDPGVGAADPVDRDRARDAVARGARVRRLRSDREAAHARGRGVGVTGDGGLRFEVVGDAGELPGELATPLAVVLNELMQNAVDHAFPREDDEPISRHGAGAAAAGRRRGRRRRRRRRRRARRTGFDLDTGKGLGLSIVQALVTGELGGTLDVGPGDDGRGHEVPRPHPAGDRGDAGGRAELSVVAAPMAPLGERRLGDAELRRRPSGRRARSCGACGARPRWCHPRRRPPGWWRGRTRGTRG